MKIGEFLLNPDGFVVAAVAFVGFELSVVVRIAEGLEATLAQRESSPQAEADHAGYSSRHRKCHQRMLDNRFNDVTSGQGDASGPSHFLLEVVDGLRTATFQRPVGMK